MPCFPTFEFPFWSSKSDMLCLMAPIVTFSYLTLFAVQNYSSIFWKANLFVFYSQNSKIALSQLKDVEFIMITWKVFKISKIADMVLDANSVKIYENGEFRNASLFVFVAGWVTSNLVKQLRQQWQTPRKSETNQSS